MSSTRIQYMEDLKSSFTRLRGKQRKAWHAAKIDLVATGKTSHEGVAAQELKKRSSFAWFMAENVAHCYNGDKPVGYFKDILMADSSKRLARAELRDKYSRVPKWKWSYRQFLLFRRAVKNLCKKYGITNRVEVCPETDSNEESLDNPLRIFITKNKEDRIVIIRVPFFEWPAKMEIIAEEDHDILDHLGSHPGLLFCRGEILSSKTGQKILGTEYVECPTSDLYGYVYWVRDEEELENQLRDCRSNLEEIRAQFIKEFSGRLNVQKH